MAVDEWLLFRAARGTCFSLVWSLTFRIKSSWRNVSVVKVGASAHFVSKIASLSIRISAPGPDRIFVCYRLSQAESVLNPHSER